MDLSTPCRSRVIVVGAGVVGLSVACRLLEAGADVVCVDARLDGMASAAALGYVSPPSAADAPEEVVRLGAYAIGRFLALITDLGYQNGRAPFLTDRGYLHVSKVPNDPELDLIASSWEKVDLQFARLSGDEIGRTEPLLGRDVRDAILLEDALSIDPFPFTQALKERVAFLGGEVRSDVRVRGLAMVADACTGVLVESGTLDANAVVLAAGSWTTRVLPVAPSDRVWPIKGQVLLLRADSGQVRMARPVSTSDSLDMMPRPSGALLIGTSNEDVGYEARPTAGVVSDILLKARSIVPALGTYEFVKAYAGLRPCTVSRRPVIGPHPELPNVVVATGHCQDGMLLAPITGDIVAGYLTGDSTYSTFLEEFQPRQLEQGVGEARGAS